MEGELGATWEAFAKVDSWQYCGIGVRDLAFIQHLLCAAYNNSLARVSSLSKRSVLLGMYVFAVSLFIFKSAYFRVTLCYFCESGPQYRKGISFSLTSVRIHLHREKNLILHFRKEPHPNKGRMVPLTSIILDFPCKCE